VLELKIATEIGRDGSGSVRCRVPLGKRARVCMLCALWVWRRRAGESSKRPIMRVGSVDVVSAARITATVGCVRALGVGFIHVCELVRNVVGSAVDAPS
jgi:hypothetical protein